MTNADMKIAVSYSYGHVVRKLGDNWRQRLQDAGVAVGLPVGTNQLTIIGTGAQIEAVKDMFVPAEERLAVAMFNVVKNFTVATAELEDRTYWESATEAEQSRWVDVARVAFGWVRR